ncbi:hypothetical protein [Paenarthrobacter aurescens]|uniref:hypothetical protein n=1 Tax=Paenarthrobacter aurescens TaxID=43663 RepID=UPI0021C0578B|nr:hypothetical protein [Paenarthrobacter aurescens]MCT9869149.1 hypothetical protein [Paenarthrobacter aurescens]
MLITLFLIAGVTLVPLDDQSAAPNGPTPPQTYPISGYFITANTEASANRQKMADIKALGGDTAITFGTLLRPSTEDSLPADCLIEGIACGKFMSADVNVHRYFTYSDGSHWGGSTLKCPKDRSVSSNGKSYTVLVLPSDGSGCSSSDGTYDVVIVGGSKESTEDPATALASAATELNMKFYAGLPAPVKRADVEYLPDLSYAGTLSLFTDRFLGYQAANNDVPGLAGFYHHFEMPISSNAFFDPVLSLYRMQNEAIQRALPSRSAIISPYIESRASASSVSPQDARLGVRRIAQTASGLPLNIAIQDGMGTGKGAAYLGSEAAAPVDGFAASIVGKGRWGEKYLAPNRDYFRAAAEGISGTGAVLWANLEGMAPVTKTNTCSNSLRGQTTLERMNRQLQQMAETAKIISFMWDPYFTCKGTGTPLKEQLKSGQPSPVVVDAVVNQDAGSVKVIGFNFSGAKATLKWTSVDGASHERESKSSSVREKQDGNSDLNPRLESIVISLDGSTLPPGTSYIVNVSNEQNAGPDVQFADGVFAP